METRFVIKNCYDIRRDKMRDVLCDNVIYEELFYLSDHERVVEFINEQNRKIEKLKQCLERQDKYITGLKKANESFSFIGEEIMKIYNKTELCCKDVENFVKQLKREKQDE